METLPSELIDAILAHGGPIQPPSHSSSSPSATASRHFLLAASLVSRTFHDLSNPLLYHTVVLDRPGALQAFVRTVRHSPELAALVRCVLVEAVEGQDALRKEDPDFRRVLRACLKLEELIVVQMHISLDVLRHEQLKSLVLWGSYLALRAQSASPHLPALASLSITSSNTPAHALARFLQPDVLPRLAHLALHGIATGPHAETKLADALTSLGVRRLSLDLDFAGFLQLDFPPLSIGTLSLADPISSPNLTSSPPPRILFDATNFAPSQLASLASTARQSISPPITSIMYPILRGIDIRELKNALPDLKVVYASSEVGKAEWGPVVERLKIRVVGQPSVDLEACGERLSGLDQRWLDDLVDDADE